MISQQNPLVATENREGVFIVTLNAPPANCYSYDMMRELDDAILEARFREDVHVIVLTGEGTKFFCAGADINMLGEVSPHFKYNFCLHANETLLRLEHSSKVVIAAINGHDALVPDDVSGSNDNAAAVGDHISSRSMTALQ